MVEQGDRCPQCGGELELAPDGSPVGAVAHAQQGTEPPEREGRFDR
jgi:hypothetical protein